MKTTILLSDAAGRYARYMKRLLGSAAIFATLIFLSSCSFFQGDTSYNVDKQIERQRMQRELNSEPVKKETRSVAEFEELGDRYLMRGDINRAYIYYVKGLGLEPDNVSLVHKQGMLLLKKKRFVEASAVYEKLLAINVRDSLALEGRGKAYFGQGKFAEAEQVFLDAIEVSPELWQSHEFLGLIYSRQQKYDKAIERFKIALAYKPHNVGISNNLAVTYYLNGDFKESVRLLKRLVKTTSDRKINNNLALAYFQLGFYEEAMEAFKRGSVNEAVAYNNIGHEFLANKKYSEAINAFEKAIELYPKFYPLAQKNLGIAKLELSNAALKAGN